MSAHLECFITDGVALMGSDLHISDEPPSTAMRALQLFSEEHDPDLLVLDGDVIDASSVSRHARIGWEAVPDVALEIQNAQEQLAELKGKRKIWPLGNHDGNMETKIANAVPSVRGLPGIHLMDHFTDWEPCWRLVINPRQSPTSTCLVKHRMKRSELTNVKEAGVSVVTGHYHDGNMVAFTDYWGDRYGVNLGMMAPCYAKQFINYTEFNVQNWRSMFWFFSWKAGQLMRPEPVSVVDEQAGTVQFRGEIFNV